MVVERVWTRAATAATSGNRIVWDAGDEQWELYSNGIRRYRILERSYVSLPDSGVCVREVVELLPESPVPVEVFARHSMEGWELVERILPSTGKTQEMPRKKVVKALPSLPLQHRPPSSNTVKKPKKQTTSTSCKLEDSEDSPASETTPQLDCWDWASLSQWIPPSALFQASLHDQAFLEESPERHATCDKRSGQSGHTMGKAHKPRYNAPRARVAVAHA